MSRHLWRTRSHGPSDDSSGPEPQHSSVFPATVRAVTGRSALPADPKDEDLPAPRPARSAVEPPPADEEITVEIPRFTPAEPADPALSMLALGRHGMR